MGDMDTHGCCAPPVARGVGVANSRIWRAPPDEREAYAVNSVKNDTEECIEPVRTDPDTDNKVRELGWIV
jgi:hypothetical protein